MKTIDISGTSATYPQASPIKRSRVSGCREQESGKLTQRRKDAKTQGSLTKGTGFEPGKRGLRPPSARREPISMSKLMSLAHLLPQHAARAAWLSSKDLPSPRKMWRNSLRADLPIAGSGDPVRQEGYPPSDPPAAGTRAKPGGLSCRQAWTRGAGGVGKARPAAERSARGEESSISEPKADRTAHTKCAGGCPTPPQNNPLRLCVFAPLRFCLLTLTRRAGQSLFGSGLSLALALALLGAWACGGGPGPEAGRDQHVDGSEHVEGDDGHDEHGDELLVRLEANALERLGLEILVAGPGELEVITELPGEVQVNGDLMAHVGPRVGGVAREVLVSLGDTVRAGQLLAILESRDLADAKAAFLAANVRLELADATFKREERLWREKISSEQDYLDALNKRAEARIEYRAAEQKLHALGFSQFEVEKLPKQHDVVLTEYRITAPFSGTVIAKHITLGETVTAETSVFTVADLSSVWIDLAVYQKDIGAIRAGQVARVSTNHGDEAELSIDFVQPLVGEQTRTALARIIAPNPDGARHPGCFVTARVAMGETESSGLVVPSTAVIRMEDGDQVVFVETDEGFEPRPVVIGKRTRDHIEVVSGLVAGDRYVGRGGFSLKAELGKSDFGDGHGH